MEVVRWWHRIFAKRLVYEFYMCQTNGHLYEKQIAELKTQNDNLSIKLKNLKSTYEDLNRSYSKVISVPAELRGVQSAQSHASRQRIRDLELEVATLQAKFKKWK